MVEGRGTWAKDMVKGRGAKDMGKGHGRGGLDDVIKQKKATFDPQGGVKFDL
jgi:hypothetical protein